LERYKQPVLFAGLTKPGFLQPGSFYAYKLV
jgi:hypothetical protein